MIPFGTLYPWGLDEKAQENTGTCVVDMVFESALFDRITNTGTSLRAGKSVRRHALQRERKLTPMRENTPLAEIMQTTTALGIQPML